jgi:uncharacterized protein (DUF427 family)
MSKDSHSASSCDSRMKEHRMIPESSNPDRDYPQMAIERGRIEPAPRRVRGYFDDMLVFDTTRARYVWEVPYYPRYYIPRSDVRMEHLRDEDHPQRVQLGSSRLHSLTTDRDQIQALQHGNVGGPAHGERRQQNVPRNHPQELQA